MMLKFFNRKFLIYGFGLSGQSCFNYLKKKNFIRIYDDKNIKLPKNLKKYFIKKDHLDKYTYDYIILSPGIDKNKCKLKRFLLLNQNKIINELDIFYFSYIENKKITVTGTNGKSTTVKLIFEMLKNSQKDVRLVGNIGISLLNQKDITKNTTFVIEASSYQIDYSKYFKSDISIILNISPDHLERHKTFKNYTDIKFKLIKNQKKNGIAIVNGNIPNIKNYLNTNKNKKIFTIGSYVNNEIISKITNNYFKNYYNTENVNFVFFLSKVLKINKNIFFKTINSFEGLPFRQQVIYDCSKFQIINDSKSTSFASSIALLKSYKNIYWLVGGLAKKSDKLSLEKKYFKNINALIYGKDKEFFENKLRGKISFKTFKNLKDILSAILKDKNKIIKNKLFIIFSPAAASFDQFNDFENRGKYFNLILKKTDFIRRLHVKK